MIINRVKERGAAPLIVVAFASVLFTIVTMGFIRIMISEQIRSSNDQLARVAYDAAMSGVEDAKRVLQLCDSGGAESSAACAAISAKKCNTVQAALGIGTEKEVLLRTDSVSGIETSKQFDQAYTCVKIDRVTKSIVGKLLNEGSNVISLKSVAPFSKVRVSWTTKEDIDSELLSFVNMNGTKISIPALSEWPSNRPAMLRSQLIQYSNTSGFNSASFDNTSSGKMNSSTIYLAPVETGAIDVNFNDFVEVSRRSGKQKVLPAKCSKSSGFSIYYCTNEFTLPNPIGGDESNREAFLRLTSHYNTAHYKIELLDNLGNVVAFDGVQPIIDSTGRVSNIYRRVAASVQAESFESELFPRATVDVTNDFSKYK